MTRWRSCLLLVVVCAQSSVCVGEVAERDHPLDGEQLVRQLSDRCRLWLSQPGPELKSLRYTFHLGGEERVVELAPGTKQVRRSMWQGATLHTGLHALAASSAGFQVTAGRIEGDPTYADAFIRLSVRPKAAGESFHLAVGNGIDGSWRGYYSHPSALMRVDLDPVTLLPLREMHEDSQYEFRHWQEVKPGRWIPRLVIAKRGDIEYRMHFAWQGEAVWLLTHAEIADGDRVRPVTRVSDVLVNDDIVTVALREEQQRIEAARKIVRAMLERNAGWLAPQPSFDSLEYACHIEPQDVTETCAVRRDGFAVFEVSGDGKGKMTQHRGNRKIVTPDDRYANVRSEDAHARLRDVEQDRDKPNYARQLRRYALIGCQFDLPLFELSRVLDDANVEIKDGVWNGRPCHVATITAPGRWGYLGCGVMLGFSSWSYIHHLYPAYEVIYIDKERLVPLHETLVTDRDDRRFEIDFDDYRWVGARDEQCVPLQIKISAANYFTSRYEFQLVDGRHWLLQTVESWFDPAEKSRGVVTNVKLNDSSPLAEEAERQIAAYREVFETPAAGNEGEPATITVETLPFELGRPLQIGPAAVVFTLGEKSRLLARCTAPAGAVEAGQSVNVLLLDDKDALLQAGCARFVGEKDGLRAEASFGRSYALRDATRFAIVGLGDTAGVFRAEQRPLRVFPVVPGAEPQRVRGIADRSGKTQVLDAALQPSNDGQTKVAVHVISSDGPQEFQFDVSAAVFDKTGRLMAATSKQGFLKVETDTREDTWELELPSGVDANEVESVAIGVTRGQTVSAPFGALWMTYVDLPGPFSLETCLAAKDSNCWPAALRMLDRELQEALDHGLLDDQHRWKRQQSERKTPADQLRPHVDRLLEIVDSAQEPATLATAIRLLGYAEDPRAIVPASQLLDSPDSKASDAAAIALGLLKSDEGLARIDEIIRRSEPARDDPARHEHYHARDDALVALATIRSESSISIVEKWMETFVDGSEVIVNERGGRQAGGSAHLLQRLAQLLGRLRDPRHLSILSESLARVEQRDSEVVPAREELLESIVGYGAAAQETIEPRVRRGDAATVYAIRHIQEDFYIDAVGTMLETSRSLSAWRPGIDYLWNRGSEDGVQLLREAFDRGVPAGERQEETRLYLAKALADRGDGRGLPTAFGVLVELAASGERPQDEPARRTWEKNVEDRREAALDVFERAATSDVAALLAERASHADEATRLAILQVVERMETIPAAVLPEVERWATKKSNDTISHLAERLLVRQR